MHMQQLLVHYCNVCTYNTVVPITVSVFSQDCACSHCGSISKGVNIRAKPQPEKQQDAAMHPQDELARLFSANLTLTPQTKSAPEIQVIPNPPQSPPAVAPPIVYSSTHYTHSSHIAAPRQNLPFLPTKTPLENSHMHSILISNDVDPSHLFPSQLDLFMNADDEQRLRLLSLWRISPPRNDMVVEKQLYDWPPTSLAQEETMAKLRAERAQADDVMRHQIQLDESMAPRSASPAVQEARGLLSSPTAAEQPEPYMTSGYDMLARREYEASAQGSALKESNRYNQATDPVYNHGWDKNVGSIMNMENQYGAFVHAREYGVMPVYADDEMVM